MLRQRVEHGVDDRRWRPDAARLADALRAQRVVGRRRHRVIQLEGRQARRNRQGVVEQRGRQKLAVRTVGQMLPERLTKPLGQAAVNLALREDCAGRVLLYRSPGAVELVEYGDPGYRQAAPLQW